jgi:hypothetical protein
MRGAVLAALAAVLMLQACGNDSAGTAPSAAGGAAGVVSCDLGSVYPDSTVIDPDAPVYEGTGWSQSSVTQAFAEAKAEDSSAYRAYRAARDHTEYMECPFCACGCAEGNGHRSAIDCFKDMHGFT